MNSKELEQKALELMIAQSKPKKGKRRQTKVKQRDHYLVTLYNKLLEGDKMYYSTLYIESLKFNFKQRNGVDIKYEKINETIFKLSI